MIRYSPWYLFVTFPDWDIPVLSKFHSRSIHPVQSPESSFPINLVAFFSIQGTLDKAVEAQVEIYLISPEMLQASFHCRSIHPIQSSEFSFLISLVAVVSIKGSLNNVMSAPVEIYLIFPEIFQASSPPQFFPVVDRDYFAGAIWFGVEDQIILVTVVIYFCWLHEDVRYQASASLNHFIFFYPFLLCWLSGTQ